MRKWYPWRRSACLQELCTFRWKISFGCPALWSASTGCCQLPRVQASVADSQVSYYTDRQCGTVCHLCVNAFRRRQNTSFRTVTRTSYSRRCVAFLRRLHGFCDLFACLLVYLLKIQYFKEASCQGVGNASDSISLSISRCRIAYYQAVLRVVLQFDLTRESELCHRSNWSIRMPSYGSVD